MRSAAAVAFFALATSACMTAGMMEQYPLTAGGGPVLYAAHPDSVMAAARGVLGEQDAQVRLQTRPDTATQVLVGSKLGLFMQSGWTRFVITRTAPETSMVRVLSRSGSFLGAGYRNRASALMALDARLEPAAILVPGTRIRVVGSDTGELRGELGGRSHDSLVVRLDRGGARGVALGDMNRLSVLRGEYRNVREGATAGAVMGLLLGAALAGQVSSSQWLAELEQYSRMMGSIALGTLVGALLGSQVRTAVWSDVDVERLRRR